MSQENTRDSGQGGGRSKWVELCALWRRDGGQYVSEYLMDDRIQDLALACQEGLVKLWIKPNDRKTSDKHPDMRVYIVPPGKRS